MRYIFCLATALALSIVSSSSFADEPTADEIVDRALDQNAMGFKSGQAQLQLVIEDKKGDRRERKLDVKSKKVSELTKTRIELLAPKEVKGQGFLFAEKTGEDDVWMYLPAFKVTRRIEGGQKDGAFLGSHFTYADLESRDLKEADYKKLADEKIGKIPVYVVEATPTKANKSDYSKILLYVRKTDFTTLKVKFFEDGDEPSRTLFVEKLDKTSGGETYAKQMTLRPAGGGRTTMIIEALSDTELDDALFSKDALGK